MLTRFKPTHLPDDLSREISEMFRSLKQKHYREGIEEEDPFNAKEIAGWFLGTQGENAMLLTELLVKAVRQVSLGRQIIFPNDPSYVDGNVKASEPYRKATAHVAEAVNQLATLINKYSLPFPSMRYQGQMNWDVTLPAMAGYLVTMLQNPNNVAFQGGPATTYLEIAVAKDICKMIGFDPDSAWAHICCDGTVANIEGMWSARELRFFPLGVTHAIRTDPIYSSIKKVDVTYRHHIEDLMKLDNWARLNLSCDTILEIPGQLAASLYASYPSNPAIPDDWKAQLDETPESERKTKLEGLIWNDLSQKYTVNALGIDWFYSEHGYNLQKDGIHLPAVIVPSTKHYSWPKAASLLGLGHGTPLTEDELSDPEVFRNKAVDQSFLNVFVDAQGRMKIDLLKKVLDNCEACRKPVLLVVAVEGSTEESAVDPLDKIVMHRDDMRKRGGDFNLHADAAWGGYMLSMLREPFDMPWPSELPLRANDSASFKDSGIDMEMEIKASVRNAMLSIHKADSVTIDPHKWGYVPYAAGSLSYRNGKIVNLVTFGAPYIGTDMAEGIGESGVEGSKPGAAAAGVFLSHHVIRPNKEGYGKIINQSLLNARMFYLYITGMEAPGDEFTVLPFNPLPPEYDKQYVRSTFYQDKPLREILRDPKAMRLVNTCGPDQTIVDYIFNVPGNKALSVVKNLNNKIFDRVYPKVRDGVLEPADKYKVFLSMTTFQRADYGDDFMNSLAKRLGLTSPETCDQIPCMRSVVMDPWVVETKQPGEPACNFFKDRFIPELRAIVNGVLR